MLNYRLDVYLNKKYGFSREHSKEIIEKGFVSVNEKIILKPSFKVTEDDFFKISELAKPKYVSRGGLKLEKAINLFNINLKDLICLDVGASTGGFTDCMLKNGARKVFSVDVGTSQLHFSLLNNNKVISLENTDIRSLNKEFFLEKIDFISIDVSFISITKILDSIFNILENNGEVVSLIKPQFEVGKENINKNGVVKNIKIHKKILYKLLEFAQKCGFTLCGLTFSPIKKANGNIEYLLYMKKGNSLNKFDFEIINKVVDTAFNEVF